MNDNIERLAKEIAFCTRGRIVVDEQDRCAARYLNRNGFIHHSDAVNYVEVCQICYGNTAWYDATGKERYDKCPACQGRGTVLKGENHDSERVNSRIRQ